MKKAFVTLLAIITAVAGLHAFRAMQPSSVAGRIVPYSETNQVYMIQGTDTLQMTPNKGTFSFTIKPGSWKVLVDAREPLQDVVLDVTVKEGQATNLGIINLQQ